MQRTIHLQRHTVVIADWIICRLRLCVGYQIKVQSFYQSCVRWEI